MTKESFDDVNSRVLRAYEILEELVLESYGVMSETIYDDFDTTILEGEVLTFDVCGERLTLFMELLDIADGIDFTSVDMDSPEEGKFLKISVIINSR